ncbi:MAG TPA: hypothetical protein VMK42_02765 [Anaeromyxobacteraceae bacterium]|nr:hypothetical protein [Anaeromyxobacteraceae bacterium]
MWADTTFELTADPEVEVGGWLRPPRPQIDGDAFPRARLGDLLEQRDGMCLATGITRLRARFSRALAPFLGCRTSPWPSRT